MKYVNTAGTVIEGKDMSLVQSEMAQYQIVKVVSVEWERLDDDREGSHFDVYYYPLSKPEDCPEIATIIVRSGHFYGVELHLCSDHEYGLQHDYHHSTCQLYISGRIVGKNVIHSSYDSPNNSDKVTEEYTLTLIRR